MSKQFILLLGVSGSGKGTVMRRLKREHPEFVYPLSLTTRPMREGEQDGVQYHFTDEATFMRYAEEGKLLEWAKIHHQQYSGILKDPVEQALKDGKTVVREVDVQGLRSILDSTLGPKVKSIFLLPPSEALLIQRIQRRSKLSDSEISRRLASAKEEIRAAQQLCDVLILSEENKEDVIYHEVEDAILSKE